MWRRPYLRSPGLNPGSPFPPNSGGAGRARAGCRTSVHRPTKFRDLIERDRDLAWIRDKCLVCQPRFQSIPETMIQIWGTAKKRLKKSVGLRLRSY